MVRTRARALAKNYISYSLLALMTVSSTVAPAYAQLSYSNSGSNNSQQSGNNSSPSADDILSNLEPETLKKLAQLSPALKPANKGNSLPTVAGTVKIRKPFKLFAQAGLIHHLSFRDTPVKEVISEIARRGNLNIIIDKSVTGRITGELRDVTLNEAMDTVLASAGLQSRVLDNDTVIVGTLQAMIQLGLNRPIARAFKLSYAHPHDVATMLQASVFNRGYVPDFKERVRSSTKTQDSEGDNLGRTRKNSGATDRGDFDETGRYTDVDSTDKVIETEGENLITRDQQPKVLRGSSRQQVQEGVGFNNAAIDPGTQQIRQLQEINADYTVSPNDGGAIVIPDARGRQVIVVGTSEDVLIAEEAINILDRRPKQVHIQASLIELTNQGIRQLGATFNVQGQGVSASIMGNSRAPLLSFIPGLGSPANSQANPSIPAIPFTGNDVTPSGAGTAFSGLVGSLLPTSTQNLVIAGVTPVASALSGVDFLTLGGSAGGAANIATLPTAVNLNLQLLLQTNKAKVIANPSLVVVDNTEALITIANEVIHKVTSTVSLGVVTTNVELAKAGIFLNVLPRVTEDGFVRIRLRPQVSSPLGAPQQFGSDQSPIIVTLLNVRDIITQEVRIKDGQTLVIGGLFTEQEAAQMAKVPYMAELPVLGAFFRTTLKGRNRTELMLMITPKIVEEDPTRITESGGTPTL